MKYITQSYEASLEVKQSKFIVTLLPYSELESTLIQLKKNHPKARHFVVSSRHLNEFNQIVEYATDDGEPKGTSGKPTLFVLAGAELINCAVIVVRYFGGTKLGTGGLVRAYSDSVNNVLELATLLEYKEEVTRMIACEYTSIRLIEYECEINNIKILEKIFENNVKFRITATKEDTEHFIDKVARTISVL